MYDNCVLTCTSEIRPVTEKQGVSESQQNAALAF